jgi:serine/threonine protein kinase
MSRLEQEGKYSEMGGHSQHIQFGSIILGGRYRLVQLLHQRPRLNLYLGRRTSPSRQGTHRNREQGPLLAIRELFLAGLSPQVRMQIVNAAFEESISPVLPGLSHFPGATGRVFVEGERHYLVMQLIGARREQSRKVLTLSELLCRPQWPLWLNTTTAVDWSIQLCCTVARLHRLGMVLGNLDPDIILLDVGRVETRPPILLVSWPPPPCYWPDSVYGAATNEQYTRVFPIADIPASNPFAAPEVIDGVYDVRSDVYSLGALLYLLCTHFAPAAAVRRQDMDEYISQRRDLLPYSFGSSYGSASLPLIPPRLLNSRLSTALEEVLLHALAFDPGDRYPSAFALVEALEALPQQD